MAAIISGNFFRIQNVFFLIERTPNETGESDKLCVSIG